MSNALALTKVSGVGPSIAKVLVSKKIDSVKKLAKIDLKELTSVPGIGNISGRNMIQTAKKLLAADKSGTDK
ncbi:MAG: helix-hairpin-helix domain-containing protein, partial [Gammaproteobacteria bacterium]|nr:helix-hairpin-helix domain-containing protein [Gammaproteobacteria bacterium]